MTTSDRIIASGPGWQVSDVVCTAGAGDRPFEEEHRTFCVAAVTSGTFRYRASQGTAMLAPGAVLLGNPGTWYECGHEHGAGDRCLSFHFAPAYMERIVEDVPGARMLAFEAPRLPPLPALMPLLAEAEAARDVGETAAFEELGLRIASAAVAASSGRTKMARTPSGRDQKRVAEAVRRIEIDADQPLSLAVLARETATSPYHFLRTFRQIAGMTPYRFLLRTRLHRAAVRLHASDKAISTIAFEAGFNDLSTFNRRFRREMGETPGGYRARRAGRR
ncbi:MULTISPECIES: AraC family transcriptional regulator [unclassified Mesorhizobium]|uniref:helix-turn-helix transcriptional regulator n=1 Tax=unclassified Mesorhizobium TaxID=325217 RepID=UPI001126403A|nr:MULTISPECIES: AraC family transcriptional regulator [unclassified Mesorhizobium]TPI51149.1 helix-turn-helix transcriptional regulator [Mesorhizobium sp. B3-1-1]TPJ79882.1 helix-turn-helix transcriptional regulator [Mesorhizobium sp. B2-6-3]TPJ96243.1 helix-turn-helix transcriptional regulator [Mesorhizobium sp. B2-5-10]TPK05661.1 helix-turn-helix transcriptional regulator [Mesorhizobium sp. B2-5-11]TPK30018.1 helix-turn-helix transcriptional regulator [Mesorhizobium sp. B2-5-8]